MKSVESKVIFSQDTIRGDYRNNQQNLLISQLISTGRSIIAVNLYEGITEMESDATIIFCR